MMLMACISSVAGAADETKGVKIRALAFTRVGDAREMLVVDGEGKLVDKKSMSLPTSQLSDEKSVPSRVLHFLATSDAEAVSDDPEVLAGMQKLGQVVLPEGGKEYILIFLPNKQGAESPYRVQALPISKSSFGSGDQAFINYCKSDLGFNFGKEKIVIHPGKVGVYRPKDFDGQHPVVGYEKAKSGKWEKTPFYSSRMIVQKGVRNLIFIVPNSATGRPEFRGITDFVNN